MEEEQEDDEEKGNVNYFCIGKITKREHLGITTNGSQFCRIHTTGELLDN